MIQQALVFTAVSSDQCPLCGQVRRESQDESLNAVFEQPRVEVDQKADVPSREPEIRQKLRFEDGIDVCDGLHLHEHEVFDDEIDAIMSECSALVIGRNWHLPFVADSYFVELNRESRFVNRLEQTGPKHAVHFDRGSDDA
jgi:hypothetical protein